MEKYKVLIVEDDETARKQLGKIIKKEGFEVFIAQDGNEGLKVFEKENPDIVISDLKMPGISGLEVMQAVKNMSQNTQVILVTAYGETDTVITAMREGALDYIKKPIDLDKLSLALGRAKEKLNIHRKIVPFPSVLIAEDEESIRMRLSVILKKENWEVYTAANGEEAVEVFNNYKIDIALLDIKMPKKDGLKTLHDLREINEDFEAIIISGYGDEKNAIQAMRDGAINFLKKPIDLDQLVMSVEKAMEKLNFERSLKFRTRELELSRKLLAKITAEKEIVVDIRNYSNQEARNFAQKLLDSITMALVVLNEDKSIIYTNSHLSGVLKGVLKGVPQKFDKNFLEKLQKVGISGISYESIVSTVESLFKSPVGTIETITSHKYICLTFVSLSLLDHNRKEKVVLIALRGERNKK